MPDTPLNLMQLLQEGLGSVYPNFRSPRSQGTDTSGTTFSTVQDNIRMNKILALMGLNSPDTEANTVVYKQLTGTTLHDLITGLDAWEGVNPVANFLGRKILGKQFLNPETLKQYHTKALRLYNDPTTPESQRGVLSNTISKLGTPKTLQDLQALYQSLERPKDIDKTIVPDVYSRILP